MQKIKFSKYQGAGNDFILIDNRNNNLEWSLDKIQFLTNRKFGIGADGVILLEQDDDADFYMRYFNPDGSQVGMCGNGSRCIGLFARDIGIKQDKLIFKALDGVHELDFIDYNDNYKESLIKVKLNNVNNIKRIDENKYFLNTGVNHIVIFVKEIDLIKVDKIGSEIRYSKDFESIGGTNVNFVEIVGDNEIKIRTYERGVEKETLACGTGATAAAIATSLHTDNNTKMINVLTLGGKLSIFFNVKTDRVDDIYLQGGAKLIFIGEIEL